MEVHQQVAETHRNEKSGTMRFGLVDDELRPDHRPSLRFIVQASMKAGNCYSRIVSIIATVPIVGYRVSAKTLAGTQ